jgi:hypothetical protein
MFKKITLFFVFFLCSCLVALAQENLLPVQFGKVSIEDLAMKTYPADSTAPAVVLYDKGLSYWYSDYKGMKLVHERHIRIKILSVAGAAWTKSEVSIYKPKNSEQIETLESLEGFTHLLKEGKIVRHKLEAQDIFLVKPTPDLQITRFVMPYCEVGAVVEYKYKTSSDYIFNLLGWEFQKPIPTVWSEYEVKIPEYFSFMQFVQGYEKYDIEEKGKIQDYFGFSGSIETVDIFTARWVIKNLAAFKALPFMENPANNLPKMDFSLENFKFSWMPSRQKLPADWQGIYEELKKEDKIVDFAKKTSGLKDLVKLLTNNIQTEDQAKKEYEIMQVLFDYVKQNMVWNKETSRMAAAKKPENVLQAKTGNSADLNLLLVALCKQAGLEAHAAVLATKETGKANPDYPMFNRINHSVAAVTVASKTYLLDATSTFSTPEMLPLRCINGKALVLADKMQTILLAPQTQNSKTITANLNLMAEGNLQGTMTCEETGYIAYRSREMIQNDSRELAIQKSLLLEGKGIGIDSFEIQNDTLVYQNLQEKISLTAYQKVKQDNNSKELSFVPMFSLAETENPFLENTRKYPVDFVFPFKEKYTLTYTIPNGYAVKNLPSPATFATADNLLMYSFEVLQSNSQLVVTHNLKVNTTKVESAKYADLRIFWEKIVQKHKELVVLKKIK